LSGHDNQDRIARTGLTEQGCQDRFATTGLLGKTARAGPKG
jgi:hypothetical protein